jgi:serine/threonine protein kinase
MAENLKCPTCGTEVPASGQCPKCLIGLGLAAGEAALSAGDAPAARGPRHFAGYKQVRQFGFGGMGVVYEAVEIDLNRPVALKLILDAQACSPVARRRFMIEAEAAARLDHPNIVPVYHVGEHEDQPFMSMKLVRGESLRAKMNRG